MSWKYVSYETAVCGIFSLDDPGACVEGERRFSGECAGYAYFDPGLKATTCVESSA